MSSGKLAHIIFAVALTAGAPALAGGTAEQRDACMADAFRLCTSAIPDEGRVESCLRGAGSRLSAACYAVFNPPTVGMASAQVARSQVRGPTSARAPAVVQPNGED